MLARGGALGAVGAFATVALAGCGGPDDADDAPAEPRRPDPETELLRSLVAGKAETVALYSAAIAAGETPGEELRPYLERHQAHLTELKRRLPPGVAAPTGAATPTTATPAPSASPHPSGSPSATPSGQAVSLSRLRQVERESAAARAEQLQSASPALAQLLASIGACEAAHAVALARLS
ncbi:hypothetical protein HNP84_002933 [Thermocatellispora tengchongensis]|uniref:DUF4439 domain-containing protein n=1 Tax=Thermocatellispora tengchongensis TaxID=1073253 RepID=A0A840P1G6_9ACTN|nr:hypothetical protein [Thermocatellispora tengchongensis]MBB5133212.1 hypothetical protein [Thermocatellispora tengchongensis]